MPIDNSNIHIQINVSEFINKLVSFLFCEFKRVTSRKEQKYFFRTFIFSNSQTELLVSFSRSTNVYVNMSFPNSKFDGNFSTYVFRNSFWYYRDLKSECLTARHILCKKILNFFICVEVRILFKKSEICMKFTFSRDHYNKYSDWKRPFCV